MISMAQMEMNICAPQRLKSQIVIVINGKGGVGKDTICDIVGKFFFSDSISAITPIKEIAGKCGWRGEKDQKSRKFLSDLKRLLIEYNDLPNQYLVHKFQEFKEKGTNDLLFVHIREPYQIEDFLNRIDRKYVTLLVRSKRMDMPEIVYGNSSDDDVEQYKYDYVFENDCDKDSLCGKVKCFFDLVLKKEGVLE